MNKSYINESEFRNKLVQLYKEEQLNYINEKWEKLPGKDRTFVIESLKSIYPEKSYLLKESRWYNTVGDVVGIFDPTGIVDLINGISYWRQGEKLFAILSWISVLPFLGDVIAKPVIGVLKLGGDSVKMFKAATVAGDAVKMASTAEKIGGPVAKLVETAPKWATKLIEILRASVGKVPYLGPRLVNLIEEFIRLFTKGSRYMKAEGEILKSGLKGEKALTAAEKEEFAKLMGQQTGFRGFRDYGQGKNYLKYITSDASLWQKFTAGAPRLFGNAATRSLMRRTKWYLGLLDSLGIGNFVGPDELMKQVPNLDDEIEDYNKTAKAKKYWNEDFGGDSEVEDSSMKTDDSLKDNKFKLDPIGSLLSSIFAK